MRFGVFPTLPKENTGVCASGSLGLKTPGLRQLFDFTPELSILRYK